MFSFGMKGFIDMKGCGTVRKKGGTALNRRSSLPFSAELDILGPFLVAKLLYKMSVRLYVCPSGLGGNVIFSAPD